MWSVTGMVARFPVKPIHLSERMQIKRILIGTEGSTTKGIVERHTALAKVVLLKFNKSVVYKVWIRP